MKWLKKKTASGTYRLENEAGHVLHDDQDNPIEFTDPTPEPEPKPTPSASTANEESTRTPDPEIETLRVQLEASNQAVLKLTEKVEQLLSANTRSIEDRAKALTRDLIESNTIVPAQASAIEGAFTALARADAESGTNHAETYAKSIGGRPGHGWTTEFVAPGQQHQNAALGIEGLGSSNGSGSGPGRAMVNLSGGRRVLDPAEGTQTVGGKAGVSADRVAELLASTDDGRAALKRARAGELDVNDLKRKVGLSR